MTTEREVRRLVAPFGVSVIGWTHKGKHPKAVFRVASGATMTYPVPASPSCPRAMLNFTMRVRRWARGAQ